MPFGVRMPKGLADELSFLPLGSVGHTCEITRRLPIIGYGTGIVVVQERIGVHRVSVEGV